MESIKYIKNKNSPARFYLSKYKQTSQTLYLIKFFWQQRNSVMEKCKWDGQKNSLFTFKDVLPKYWVAFVWIDC